MFILGDNFIISSYVYITFMGQKKYAQRDKQIDSK